MEEPGRSMSAPSRHERADDLGRVRAMPWGVRVKMEKPPDVAVVIDEKDARYARVFFDQAVERSRVAVLKSALELNREQGAGRQRLWLLHDRSGQRSGVPRAHRAGPRRQ